jgi:tetratricopeptide (TPR) repeat protein
MRAPDFLIQDGMWKLRAGDFAGARSSLEEALKLNPADFRALEVLKRTYLAQKQPSLAVQKVKEYAAQAPQSAPVQHFLANLLMVQGNLKDARAALVTANNDDPNFIPAYLSLVQVDAAEHKFDDAASRLQKVLSVDGHHNTARIWLGNIAEIKGDHKEALKMYSEVVAADPRNAQALNNVAYLTAEFANQPNEAFEYAQKAQQLEPNNPNYDDTLGWILYRKGLYSAAVKFLERTSARQGNVVWQYHLAMAYAKSGDMKRGKMVLQSALKRNPHLPEARMAQDVVVGAL